MRFSSAIIAVLSAGLAPALAMSIFPGGEQSVLGDDNKIPGESPLELCDKSHDNDIIHIESVDLAPNPPLAYVIYHLNPILSWQVE
jgi:hypothetical protein